MKILISDQISPFGVDILKQDFEVDFRPGLSKDELLDCIAGYTGLVIRSGTRVDQAVIDRAERLKIVGRAGTGVDNVDLDAATRRGIIVMNTPGGNTISTAEHTIAMFLALSRNIAQADASLRAGAWKRKDYIGTELYDKTVGIVGLGRVGREVAERLKGFRMQTIAFDPIVSTEEARKMQIELVSLDDLITRSDYITVHTPLTEQTRHLISKQQLEKCRSGVRIVNCARGGILDEAALYDALKSGKVAGAALDVFEKEPPENNPLLTLPTVIVTPHLGASTEEAQEKVAVQIAQQVRNALLGNNIVGAVNTVSMDRATLEILEPYLSLAYRLGTFQSQIIEGNIEQLRIHYYGEIFSDISLKWLTNSFLAGVLNPLLNYEVNIVNAPHIARTNGIEIDEHRSSEHKEFSSMIRVEARCSGRTSILAGAMFGKSDPRLIQLDAFSFDARLGTNLLVVMNADQPGMLGKLGTILGKYNVNIATLSLGRSIEGGDAVNVLNLDSEVSQEIIAAMKESGFYDIKFVRLTDRQPFKLFAEAGGD